MSLAEKLFCPDGHRNCENVKPIAFCVFMQQLAFLQHFLVSRFWTFSLEYCDTCQTPLL